MSWDVLKEKIEEQKRNKAQPLTFTIIAKVNVSSINFDNLALSIREANALYAPFYNFIYRNIRGDMELHSDKVY